MRTFLKIIALLLLLITLIIAVVLFLPDQQYQQIAKKLVENALDRDISIGELITTRSLNPSLEIKDFTVSNASWADDKQMISAGKLFVSLDLKRLLEGKLQINDLSARNLTIKLRKNEQGLSNWQFKSEQADPNKKFDKELLTRIILSEFKLTESQISFVDEQKKLKYRLQLPDFQLLSDGQNPDIQNLSAQGKLNDLPFSLNGEIGLIDSLVKNKSLPFNIESRLNESDLAINGQLVEQLDSLYLTTKIVAHTQSLTDLSVFTANELPSIGPIEISADIAGNVKAIKKQGIDVNDLLVNVDDPAIKLNVKGDLSSLGAANEGDVSINLDVSDLSKLTQLFGVKKQLPGTLIVNATAAGSGENFDLQISKAQLDSTFLSAQMKGQVEDLFNARYADLNIDANAPNLNIVNQLFGQEMPSQWGPVEATATLNGGNGQYALEQIVASLSGDSKLTATGKINNLIKFDGMDLNVDASLATLNEISTFTRSPLPELGPITANGIISWREGKLSLTKAKANYNGDYGLADVSGSIGDLIKFDVVRLKADAKVPDLDVAELFSGIEMPDLKDIQASADLVSPTALDLSAKNLNASYQLDGVKVNAVGSIDSMIKNRAILNLDVDASLDYLASVNTLLKTNLPKIGPISAQAKLTGATKNIELNEVDVLLSDSALYGTLRGDIGRLTDFKGIDLDVDLSTPEIKLLFSRLELESDVKKPANLTSHVKYESGRFDFQGSELDIGGSKVIGDLSLLNFLDKNSRPKINGKVNVLNFNIPDLAGKKQKKPDDANSEKLLSKVPLPFEFIEKTDLDLLVNIGRLRGNIFDLTNSSVAIKSNDGVFKLGPFRGKFSGGDAAFQMDINVKNKPTRTLLNVNIEGFDMAQAGAFRDTEQIESTGDAFLNFKLDAKGRTMASIMASADGGGALYFEGLLLKKGTLDLFTTDLFKKTLDAINPFRKKQKDTLINCAALTFKIDDGLLTTPFGLAAEASEYSVTGNGRVDFKTEAIDLEFKTKVKKFLAINPLEKLTGLVKVVGEMTAPVVTLNPKGIFEIGATVGAAIATGGLSFLAQDQLEKLTAKSELCSKALGKTTQVVNKSQNFNEN